MTDKDLAEAIIKNALKYHNPDGEYPPSLVIDKEDYSDFDMEKVKAYLSLYKFVLMDGLDAPAPFCEMDEEFRARKWFIVRKEKDDGKDN